MEFRVESDETQTWGKLTDISLHGCYVEMTNTYPVDTRVELVMKSCGLRIQAAGDVRASYPGLGMGICLTRIDPLQKLQLIQLLSKLTGHTSIAIPEPAIEVRQQEEKNLKNVIESADPRPVLDEIAEFFRKNHLLSRDEFHGIAKRLRRP